MAAPTEIIPISNLQLSPDLQKNGAVTSISAKPATNQQQDVTVPVGTKSQAFAERHQKRTLASFSLEGQTCVITGGARGIGLVLGEALITSGADLAIVDINIDEAKTEAARLERLFNERNPDEVKPVKVTCHYSDVADPNSVDAAIAEIIKEHGKIDSLVTSAGFTENYDAVDYPFDRMKKLWGVNVDGTYLFATAVARHLMARKSPGSLVLIGSMSGHIINVPQPQTPYNVSKAAVKHMAASLAVEWAPFGIRVNCLSPGYTMTALTEKILAAKPELTEKWVSLTPQGRLGRPDDLVGAVAFLLSDASRYMTGSDLRVDGGYTVI